MGGFCFGYHLGVVNGPLNAIATSLGFAGDVGKAGLVVSRCGWHEIPASEAPLAQGCLKKADRASPPAVC